VVAEQFAGRVIVLADHNRCQFFDVGKHAPLSVAALTLSPGR
jgi:hypothetical protein